MMMVPFLVYGILAVIMTIGVECDTPSSIEGESNNPCNPSPCGRHSQCAEVNNHTVCSCLPGYVGSPPVCRKECMLNADCADDLACVNEHCISPCELNTCGLNAECSVLKHLAICECIPGFVGNPMFQCYGNQSKPQMIKMDPKTNSDPEPCGRNTIQFNDIGIVICICQDKFIGNPYVGCNTYHECDSKYDCLSNKTCIKTKCVDPCPGDCTPNDECYAFNHKSSCHPKGSNPECTANNDCPSDKACDGFKCVDPCLDFCVENADCKIVNQKPTCACKPGFGGLPYKNCRPFF